MLLTQVVEAEVLEMVEVVEDLEVQVVEVLEQVRQEGLAVLDRIILAAVVEDHQMAQDQVVEVRVVMVAQVL
jgi:hypothetical protein